MYQQLRKHYDIGEIILGVVRVKKYASYAKWRIFAIANKHGDYFRVFVVSRFDFA